MKPAEPLVLGYHAVSSRWQSQLAVPEVVLRAQLTLLARRGYVGLTLADAERRRVEGSLPLRSVVVTFDDGYASTVRAVPIMAELGFPGTVFVVTRFVDSGERLCWHGIEHWLGPETRDELRPLGWAEIEALAERGWEIGSHTATHPLLTAVDDDRLTHELRDSGSAIAERLGSCTSLSYPYGIADERVVAEARRCGYDLACSLTFTHLVDEPLCRPRIGLSGADRGLRLALQVSSLGRRSRRSAGARVARALHVRRNWLPSATI
jgi:peptidoglycan/xylan/chitin deacetylase (PgdA/CDA1 family)